MSVAEPISVPAEPERGSGALAVQEAPSPPTSPTRRWPAWLPTALVLLAGAILFLPAIRTPRFLDDYFQTSMIEGTYPAPRSPFDLYDFVGDADRALLLDRGLLPWWSHPQLKVRFLRPLSSALLYADHRVFGDHPLLSHLHSFAWWAAAVLAAGALYRRTLTSRAAVVATFMFALAPCHALPLVWLANREALVSITFGILALGALVRFRQGGRWLHGASAAGLFTLSLLGGEYALGFGGYALALALTSRRSSRSVRAVGLLSFAAPALAYLVVRARLGYGTAGSGLYQDPFRDPVAFLQRVPQRMAALLGEGWLTLPADTVDATPSWLVGAIAIVAAAILFVPVRRALAGLDGERREDATWLLLGSVLALTPVLAVMPALRVLGASFVGIAATVALVLDRAWFPRAAEPPTRASRLTELVALCLGFAHFVHGPGTSWLISRFCRADAAIFSEEAATLRSYIPDPAKDEVVLVRGIGGTMFVLPYAIDPKGAPPWRWRILALTGHVLVSRVDSRTIDLLAPPQRSLFPTGEGNLFRGEGAPLAAGDVVRVSGMRATVMDVGKAGPRRVRFEFDEPLESSSRVWVTSRFDGIHDADPPEPGFGKPFDP